MRIDDCVIGVILQLRRMGRPDARHHPRPYTIYMRRAVIVRRVHAVVRPRLAGQAISLVILIFVKFHFSRRQVIHPAD
jgi:hypothetical protein